MGLSICTACKATYEPKPPKWLHCDLDEAPIRPDWGHGPKKPVLMFTEDEIREVMPRYTGEYIIKKLKENRYGRQAHLHPNFAERGKSDAPS